MRDFEQPGRSTVMARRAMAATSNPASTLTAIRILEQGGNAIDAAIGACAVQCVVEPGSTGIGGDCFVLYSKGGTDDIIAYDGSGWAPAAADAAALRAKGLSAIERQSPHAVTVPGAVDAWTTLSRDHGRLPLSQVLADAIRYAEDGYVVAPRAAADWAGQVALLRRDPAASQALLVDGEAPREGSVHRQPALGASLRAIAERGADAFYRGEIARDIVDTLRAQGGVHTLDDFAAFRGEYVTPISTAFRGHRVFECPPAGQGVIALLILNILSGFPAEGDPGGADRLHLEIEASRLAYSVRDAVLADPRHSHVDVETLLSESFAAELRRQIDPARAMTEIPSFVPPPHSDTVYLTVVDEARNCVSFINSIFNPFGSGLMAAKSGVLLQNRGQGFTLAEGHPNTLAPHRRPLHTIIPGIVTRDGRVQMTFGVMGGQYQASGHAHFVSKVLDYGMDVQAAAALPRYFPLPGSDKVEVEDTLPAHVRDALVARGFKLVKPNWAIGGAQAIRIDWESGVLFGASDHRKDGCALGM